MGKAFDIGLNQLAGMSVHTGASDEETRTLMIKEGCRTQDGGALALAGQPGVRVPQKAGQTFYLETFGCQMNEHDSEKVAGVLLARGYRQVEKADAADVILYNTCSIREKAAQKVFSRLGEWRPEEGGQRPATRDRRNERLPFKKRENQTILRGLKPVYGEDLTSDPEVPPPAPSHDAFKTGETEEKTRIVINRGCGTPERTRAPIIGVLGCVAQQEGEKIFERAPWVSLVCGSASYRKLPQLIQELEQGNRRVTGLDTDTEETFETEITRRDNPFRAYLTIIEGCDKACSYCVVPFTRGPERSRTSASVLEEVRRLADTGYSEIQLLGQTVNSYKDPSSRRMTFAELLVEVAAVPGIRRVRFTTSHPRDFGRDIVQAIESVPGICEHVHLPVQSGSTRILREMLRTYTRDEYLEKIAMIREARRPISVTSDIIVGFPGETEKDLEDTLTLLDAVQYDGIFAFQYSPRPNTAAREMPDAIPEEEKGRRLARVLDRQREIQLARNETLVGQTFEVL